MAIELPEEKMKLATIYVVFQEAGEISTPEKGLEDGTIFPELVQPYAKRLINDFAYPEVKNDG